ncbi:unnamed protein product [Adineta steineri]|uniref:tRNA (34-2'-O)-methyltransferase regulator WDR6 n=2 Tax=Adineta steineri TaxID=433720 RepID=A0A819B295_9BILA|nr:unnamed protein product [Adineta steineri]
MNHDFFDTDNDENVLFDSDTSTENSEHVKKSQTILHEYQKKPSNIQSDSPYNFTDYLEIYERIYAFHTQGEHQKWQGLFDDIIKQSSTPYKLLYMFLDHTLSTTNNKKHRLIIPLIDQFKQIKNYDQNPHLDDTIKYNILSKICRRCIFSQLESIIDIFDLRSTDNRQLVIDFINEQIEQHQDIIFISQMTKILKLLEIDAIQFEKIVLPLILKLQWETIRFIVGDDKILQRKLLKTIDDLISTDETTVRRLFSQCLINTNTNFIDTRSVKRAARKLLKQYDFSLHEFPNLAAQEKLSFLKTLFVRKYLENKNGGGGADDDGDDESWKEQITELIDDNHDLQVKLVDLFVDYTDIDSAVEWARFYNLEDFELPVQVKFRRQEILQDDITSQSYSLKSSTWLTKQSEDNIYKPTVLPSDIVYIEVDSDVDSFLNRLECARCDVGSHLPFVGFDCETFMDPTQRTLNSQIVSIIQLASSVLSRDQSLYGIFDMLALRLQFDMKTLAEFAQRLFCSRDFILLTYNYAGDTSFLIENYPSMSDALMQGTAVIDLFRVQQYICEHYPEVFPYHNVSANLKSRGLSELVRLCFGKPLDKSLQTSDWRKRPLKKSQLIYSVLDARVLVDIAMLIEERTRTLQISWSWSDFKGAPVTAIKVLPKHRICLAGTGPYVLAFDLTTNQQLLQEKILIDSVVHGFEARQIINDSSYIIVVFGQRTFSIIQWSSISPSVLKTIIPQTQCPSWIISALIVHLDPSTQLPTILFGTALNQIYRYNKSLELIQSLNYTTLYSSCLFHHTNETVIFAAGTVFGELFLYEQDSNNYFHEKTNVSDHNGAIFGITYYNNLLCTVGDDRTVKLYKFQDSLELLSSFFAHDARIWQSSLTSTNILTCGEDSSIRLWSHKSTGEILRSFSVHRCKSVWCMDVLRGDDDDDDKSLIIISGWSDGGVRRYHLDDVPIDSHRTILLNKSLENDFPRNVIFFNSLIMIVYMNSGQLLKIDKDNITLFYDGRNTLKNGYAKMSMSNDENEYLLAVGSLNGFVFIFDHNGIIKNQFQIETNKNNKILQILWLNNTSSSKLLVCIPDGIMFVYNISNQPAILEHRLEVLPEFEQRWPNTCLYLQQYNILLVGDRQGNILSYDLNNNLIYQKVERLHGINGTSSIDIDKNTNLIRSCGRDGYINIFSINNDQRQLIHQSTCTITSDITWLDRLIDNPSLVTCFTTNNFCLYTLDDQTKRRLMQVECGGGHRNHDFLLDKNYNAYFVYIRNKQVYLAEKNLMRILNESTCLSIIPPTHGTEIRCVKLFQSNNHFHMITGSEDTQIKLFTFQTEKFNSKCEHISTLQSHLSAVCDIIVIDSLFFSCGARAQLFAWQMKNNIVIRTGYFMLHPLRRRHGGGGNINDETKKDNHDEDHGLDVRFTSVAAISLAENGNYLLFVTGSDAILRVFRYTTVSNRFSLIQTCSHSEYCQLRVKVYSNSSIAFVSSTDGLLCAYDFSSLDSSIRSTTFKVHQSGINDFDIIEINQNNLLRLASVGDDGSVHVSSFDIKNWIWKREYSKDCIHQSPATGIRFLNSTCFISIGIDQRLKLWTIKNDEQVLELTKNYLVDIRDILSMDMIFCDKKREFTVVIVGAGVQTVQFDLTNCLFYS